jgi:hypothetical protein
MKNHRRKRAVQTAVVAGILSVGGYTFNDTVKAWNVETECVVGQDVWRVIDPQEDWSVGWTLVVVGYGQTDGSFVEVPNSVFEVQVYWTNGLEDQAHMKAYRPDECKPAPTTTTTTSAPPPPPASTTTTTVAGIAPPPTVDATTTTTAAPQPTAPDTTAAPTPEPEPEPEPVCPVGFALQPDGSCEVVKTG